MIISVARSGLLLMVKEILPILQHCYKMFFYPFKTYFWYKTVQIYIWHFCMHRFWSSTVRLMSQCKRMWGDIFVTPRSIKLIWQTNLDHLKVLDEFWGKISIEFDNWWNIFQKTLVKNRLLSATLWRCGKRSMFLQWGSMGKFFTHCRIWMKFCL